MKSRCSADQMIGTVSGSANVARVDGLWGRAVRTGGGNVLVILIVDAMAVRRRTQALGMRRSKTQPKGSKDAKTPVKSRGNQHLSPRNRQLNDKAQARARQGPVVLLPFARLTRCRRHFDKDSPGWNIASKYMDGGTVTSAIEIVREYS